MQKQIEGTIKEGLVSIIMPAYNCGQFISKTIDSVISQNYSAWEMIVVDDCSSDNTEAVVKEYIKSDSRIKYFRGDQNKGAAYCRNKAIRIAQGEFIAFLDSDDLWSSDKLEKQIKFMIENDYNFTSTSYSKIDEE